jgi:hypothetical protein
MTCETPKETLIDLLAGELSEEEAVRVEQHLAECPACRVEMKSLALMTHPFLSEETWQPDAAMADRVLRRGQADGWVASSAPASTPAVPVHVAVPTKTTLLSPAQPSASSRVQAGVRPPFPARPRRPALLSWMVRPIPSYATIGIALLALVAGLLLGGGVGTFGGRGLPTEAGGPDQPSRPRGRSAERMPERLAARQADDDSSLHAMLPARRGRASTGAHGGTRPIAFVAVYTDAMRLTTPGVRDSF